MLLDTRYKQLEQKQIKQLKNILLPHGNGTAIASKTGLNINTIKRAAEGLRVSEETADILVNFLNTINND
jgi:hypothetical protein